MSVSFVKHKQALVDAWKSVLDNDSDTVWAVFGYEGKAAYDLKVVETGDDLDELGDELNGSKIMYAFCSIKDPNTSLQKYVLINWQGEGAPTTQKGTCARHLTDIANLLRGAHVTINARTEDDIEIDDIVKKVARSSGSNYSFHKETAKPMPAIGPVGAVYKRTRADLEIQQNKSDEFWKKTEDAERLRVANEKEGKKKEKQRIEEERKSREKEEAMRRENQLREKSKMIDQAKSKEIAALEQSREDEQKRWESKQPAGGSPSRPKVPSKQQEAAEMVSSRTNNPKAFFANKASAPPPRPPVKAPIRIPKDYVQGEVVEAEPEPEPVQEEPEPIDEPPALPPARVPSGAAVPVPPAPYRQDSDEEPAQEDDWEDEASNQQVPEDTSYEPEATYGNVEDSPETAYAEVDAPEDEYPDTVQESEPNPQGSGVNIRARVVYDYQAEDDSELSFDIDDIIENIDKIDDGWWMGTGPDGRYGMFPANYVEEI